MELQAHYLTPPHPCSYLGSQIALLEYMDCRLLSLSEYGMLLENGWRRFGRSVFRPRCPFCTACWSLRVIVDEFKPNRSQRRNIRENVDNLELRIGSPSVSDEKLRLHDAFHRYQSNAVGWPRYPAKDFSSYAESFVNNPFPTEEWCYYLNGRLVGVGYVDNVPQLGLSAIYFFYAPQERHRGLGTWNVMSVINRARELQLRHVYLGYYVEGCRSLEYKARFQPNEFLAGTGSWQAFSSKVSLPICT